jgi:hypothetical protein
MDWYSAFKGLKVIDLTGGVAGPSCAMMLAQHGADVIKIENPRDGGDWARILGKRYEDHSAFSLYATLGKRSVALDLTIVELVTYGHQRGLAAKEVREPLAGPQRVQRAKPVSVAQRTQLATQSLEAIPLSREDGNGHLR